MHFDIQLDDKLFRIITYLEPENLLTSRFDLRLVRAYHVCSSVKVPCHFTPLSEIFPTPSQSQFTTYTISIINIRRSHDSLILKMWIHIHSQKDGLYFEISKRDPASGKSVYVLNSVGVIITYFTYIDSPKSTAHVLWLPSPVCKKWIYKWRNERQIKASWTKNECINNEL